METLNNASRRNARRRFFLIAAFSACILLCCTSFVMADEKTALVKLNSYEIDSISNIFNDMGRSIGFSIIKGIGKLADGLYDAIAQIYDALTFSYSAEIMALVNKYSVLYKSIFIVTVAAFGLYLLAGKNFDKLNTANCIIVMILVIAAMPLFMQKMGNLTTSAAHYAQAQWNNAGTTAAVKSITGTILKEQIVDLRKVDDNMSGDSLPNALKKNKGYNNMSVNTWRDIDINERMDYESGHYTLKHKSVWENKLEPSSEKGDYATTKLDGWFEFTSNYYYRYQIVDWFAIFVQIGTLVFVLFFLCVRTGKFVIDLAMAMVYTPFIAVTDITTGQRIKAAITDVIANFAALFLMIALMGVYFAGFTYINGSDFGFVAELSLHIGLAWAILDGPNIIERIIGVDTGYSGVWQKLVGAKAAADMGKGAARTAATAGKGLGRAASTAGVAIFGKQHMNDAKNTMKGAPGEAVKKATDGKGLLGAAEKAGGKINDKFPPEHSTAGLEKKSIKTNRPTKQPGAGPSPFRPGAPPADRSALSGNPSSSINRRGNENPGSKNALQNNAPGKKPNKL